MIDHHAHAVFVKCSALPAFFRQAGTAGIAAVKQPFALQGRQQTVHLLLPFVQQSGKPRHRAGLFVLVEKAEQHAQLQNIQRFDHEWFSFSGTTRCGFPG